jgi:hypothetical protein
MLARAAAAFALARSAAGSACPPPHPWPPGPLCSTQFPGYIDIKSVPADLTVPNLTASFCAPAPGHRVLVALPGWPVGAEAPSAPPPSECACAVASNATAAFFMLYLPTDYDATRAQPFPVIVELPGNGPYTSLWGDRSNGRPDDTFLGYGITEGRGAIWAAVPFLTANGAFDQTLWWGCALPADAHLCGHGNDTEGCISTAPPPTWGPPASGCPNTTDTTMNRAYLRAVVAHLLSAYNGDGARVVLAGFSRGAIGVNYIGLGDDATAALWAGSIAYAHYDGQPEDLRWPYPENTPADAYARLKRLGARPQFICSELDSTLNQTKPFVNAAGFFVNATFAPTGYCNHNSEWVLRPSSARDQLRAWYKGVVA